MMSFGFKYFVSEADMAKNIIHLTLFIKPIVMRSLKICTKKLRI